MPSILDTGIRLVAAAAILSDTVCNACRRAGERLGDTAFKRFGGEATETDFFAIEWLAHGHSDAALKSLMATDHERLLAKILIGHSMRKRYEELVRAAPVVKAMRARAT